MSYDESLREMDHVMHGGDGWEQKRLWIIFVVVIRTMRANVTTSSMSAMSAMPTMSTLAHPRVVLLLVIVGVTEQSKHVAQGMGLSFLSLGFSIEQAPSIGDCIGNCFESLWVLDLGEAVHKDHRLV